MPQRRRLKKTMQKRNIHRFTRASTFFLGGGRNKVIFIFSHFNFDYLLTMPLTYKQMAKLLHKFVLGVPRIDIEYRISYCYRFFMSVACNTGRVS